MSGPGRFPLPIVAVFVLLFLSHIFSDLELDPDLVEDFPLFAAIAAFVLFRVIASRTGTKRRVPVPMPKTERRAGEAEQPKGLGFELPPLRGAPKEARAETRQAAPEADAELLRQQSLQRRLAEKKAREEEMEQERLRREHQTRAARKEASEPLPFSPDALRSAILWSEIIAPPKALRKH